MTFHNLVWPPLSPHYCMCYFFGLFSPSLCLPQDIGVQGYSTLHCIRGAVEIQPVSSKKPSLTQMESTLAHMNIESPQDEAEGER